MSKELTIFKNGAAPSTVFDKANLPRTKLGEGIEGGLPYKRIGYKGKDWSVNDGALAQPIMRLVDGQSEKNPYLDIVIVKAANHPTRRWYKKTSYDEADHAAPDCYSTKGFKPDAAATDKQEGATVGCINCKWSAWASKEGSRGKACREYSTLAVVPVGDIPNLSNRGPMQLSVPPNSLKALKNYGAQLDALGLHYAQVHTRIKFVAGELFEMDFDALGVLDDLQAQQVVKVLANPMVDRILDEEFAPAPSDDVGREDGVGTVQKLKAVEPEPKAAAPAQVAEEPVVQAQKPKEEPAPAPKASVQTTDITDAPKLTPAEQEIADLKAKLAAAEAAVKPKGKGGRPKGSTNRTPQVAPTNMDSEKLAGPSLPPPVGAKAPANDEELPAPGNDPALAKLNSTLNRAKDLL